MTTLHVRPTCAVCGTPVERVTEEHHEDGVLKGRVSFTAFCHGDSERVTVPARHTTGLNFGLAFASSPRALPPATP